VELATLEDRWIVSRLAEVIQIHDSYLSKSDFVHAVAAVKSFFWDDYCDWYLEIIKNRLWAGGSEKLQALKVALACQQTIIKLLHPYMPFVTEELWQNLRKVGVVDASDGSDVGSLALTSWPDVASYRRDPTADTQIGVMASIVRGVRDVRQNLNISPKTGLAVKLVYLASGVRENFRPVESIAKTMGSITEFSEPSTQAHPAGYVPFKFDGGVGYLELPSDIDAKDSISKLTARIEKLEKSLVGIERNLSNQDFVKNAPPELVSETKGKAQELRDAIAKLDDFRRSLA
jgi:valyl-tRNA synthetase